MKQIFCLLMLLSCCNLVLAQAPQNRPPPQDRPPQAQDRQPPPDRPQPAQGQAPAQDRPQPPQGRPQALGEAEFPEENPFSEAKRILGKILFWDEQLSSDNSTACGSCHTPGSGGADSRLAHNPGPDSIFGTADDTTGSPGIVLYDENLNPLAHSNFGYGPQVSSRAAPSMLTSMFADELFWDGRAGGEFRDPLSGEVLIAEGAALETQALGPILNSAEMAKQGRTWADVTDKLETVQPLALASDIPSDMASALAAGEDYPELFELAFGDSAVTPARIAMALATYERTLVPDQSPWDRFIQGNFNAMTASQRDGWELYRDSPCIGCHRPPLFSDQRFATIGLRPVNEDRGRQEVTNRNRDRGAFKVPSLRNVGLRKALTHVGWISSTSDALDFYNAGTHDTGHEIFTNNLSDLRGPGFGNQDLQIDDIDFLAEASTDRTRFLDFLNTALTDPRVANESYPFDRPRLASESLELSQGGQALALTFSDSEDSATESTRPTTFGGLFTVNERMGFGRRFNTMDRLSINTVLDVAEEDVGKAADIFVIAYYNDLAFMRTGNGNFVRWNGEVDALQPFLSRDSLSSSETVPIVSRLRNLGGDFSIYLAYLTADSMVFTPQPLSFRIDETELSAE